MKEFFKSLLSHGGKISSKRVITLFAFILMSIGFLANLFFDYKIDEFIFESIQWVVMVGFGSTVTEKFSRYKEASVGGKKQEQDNSYPSDMDNI